MSSRRSPSIAARAARPLIFAALVAGLAGCETVGNGRIAKMDDASAQSLLVPGRTTEAQVTQALGQGDVIRFESGWQTWHYLYREGLGAGWDAVPYINLIAEHMHSPTKELVLLFDPDGTLRRWSFEASRNSMSGSGTS